MRSVIVVLAATLAFAAPLRDIRPVLETEALAGDPDDPAIWLNPNSPDRSLIVGTLKEPAPNGALVVFTLDGKIAEVVPNIDRPNNVDIQGDIVVTTERYQHQLRVYRITEQKPHLRLLGTVPVFEGEAGERSEPMGIAIYERPSDRALFAVVSRKTGPADGYIWQYRLELNGNTAKASKVREFGLYSA